MKTKILMLVMAVMMTTAYAGAAHPRHRHNNNNKRIQHGMRTGKLTPHETRVLRMQQARVRSLKRMAAADGRVTPAERRIIRNEQYKMSRNIYVKKNNCRR